MVVRKDRFPQVLRKYPDQVSQELRVGALQTLAGGMARSPVLTGATKASHAVHGAEPGSLSMLVTVSTEYSPFVHEGTRRRPGRPWLRETAEQTFPDTIARLRALERHL